MKGERGGRIEKTPLAKIENRRGNNGHVLGGESCASVA